MMNEDKVKSMANFETWILKRGHRQLLWEKFQKNVMKFGEENHSRD